MEDLEGQITLRLNYRFGQGFDEMWERPSYNLASVMDRRFDKVRRTNEIRVQVRQDPNVTAQVTFAQGANVSVGQALAFGATITTGNSAGDAATVVFGNGARLDVGQNTQVRMEADAIVLLSGLIQFTSGTGGISAINTPGGTVQLIGTDVDVRTSGGSTTLRVRDGAADFTDDTGTTRVSAEQLGESRDGDGTPPQIRGEATDVFDTHASETHAQLDLIGPTPTNRKAAPYASDTVRINGTLASGNTLTFVVPLSAAVSVAGTPRLHFTLGGQDRYADYISGSGTNSLVFTYDVGPGDGTLSNIAPDEIEKNGGTLTGTTNGAAMIRQVSGSRSGSVPAVSMLGRPGCPAGDLSAPTNSGCARIFGVDPTDINDVMIYAGDVPDTDTDFFVRRCDLGQDYDPVDEQCEDGSGDPNTRSTMAWKDSNTTSDTDNTATGTVWTNVNATDGPNNTATLVADVSGTHAAAEACNALPGGGWYLPAISELDMIYNNLNATDDPDHPLPTLNDATDNDNSGTSGPLRTSFDTNGQYYWSSTESVTTSAWVQRFSDGSEDISLKVPNRAVRCARR